MKVIIAGGRNYNDYTFLKQKCDYYLQNLSDIEIVSGTCRGADKLGERYCDERGYILTAFPAEWDKYANSAGRIRNEKMAKYADCLIAFWDGESRGTRHMIAMMKKYRKPYKVVLYGTKTPMVII